MKGYIIAFMYVFVPGRQEALECLLALIFAHLLADFPLQRRWMVEGKKEGKPSAYLVHIGLHLALSALALLLFAPGALTSKRGLLALVLIAGGHLALDFGKSRLLATRPRWDHAWTFLVDQALHLSLVAYASSIVSGWTIAPFLKKLQGADYRSFLAQAVIVTLVVFPAGYLIRYLLQPLRRALTDHPEARKDGGPAGPESGLENAGLFLGWIERALLCLAFAGGSITAIGLIVGAKSLARFPEFKSRAFAEYFLIGTLLSVGAAAVGGALLAAVRGGGGAG